MRRHAAVEKKKIILLRGNAELKTIYKCIVATSGRPDKAYLRTEERGF